MALNKSGLPPMKRPVVAAERPGGFGTVQPTKPSLSMGSFDLSSIKGPAEVGKPSGSTKLGRGIALARGGMIPKMPTMPKMPKPPKVF